MTVIRGCTADPLLLPIQQPYLYDQTVQTFDYVKLGYFYNQGIR